MLHSVNLHWEETYRPSKGSPSRLKPIEEKRRHRSDEARWRWRCCNNRQLIWLHTDQRPFEPKHYHPLLAKEEQLTPVVNKILSKQTAEPLPPKGSRPAHLYGLPKTHKAVLSMRPILSATTTISDLLSGSTRGLNHFQFATEIQSKFVNEDDVLVSWYMLQHSSQPSLSMKTSRS